MKLKIVSYNIRTLYSHPVDGVNSFIHRAGMILEKIDEEKPHVICFQEISDGIRSFLNAYLKDYALVGHGRLADYSGEGLSIAFRKDCMELMELEQFWLSSTPYLPGSRFEAQSQYPRLCQIITLKHKELTTPIRFGNVHLDHISDEARILGVHQILTTIAEINKKKSVLPFFLMGDFNAYPESETIFYCKEKELVDLSEMSGGTFHDFGKNESKEDATGKKIDYIFSDKETAAKENTVTKWEDSRNGIYLSDHYPLCCEIEF